MFKLILIVTVVATQAVYPFEHNRSPFPSRKACEAALEETRAPTVAYFEEQLGAVTTDFRCVEFSGSLSESDRLADEVARIFRNGRFGQMD